MNTERTGAFLIGTKLNRPKAGRWVPRPRLFPRMAGAAEARLTLVSAPAGFGKTTLACQWLDKCPCRSAWLSLDSGDSDPGRFLRYLMAALRRAAPENGAGIEDLLATPQLPPAEILADALLREWTDLREPLTLVLEDYHTVSSDVVHQVLLRLVEFLPASVHLIILTRVDPPLPLGRWRARQWLSEVRAADLNFSLAETREFLRECGLRDDTAALLHQKTEGWAAGLRLATLSLAETADPDRVLSGLSGGDRLIEDYLLEEVIAHQPAEVMDFLAVTALLDRFCAPLCDHLLEKRPGDRPSREVLALLEQENLFLVALDNTRTWYRYHHLFQQMVVQYLPGVASPEQRARIARRAAEWFAGEGFVEEALRLWIEAGDLDAAAELLGQHLRAAIEEDLSRRLLARWLALFPAGAEKDRLPLLLAHVYLKVVRWDLEGIAGLLQRAETCPRGDHISGGLRDPDPLAADLEAQRAFICFWRGEVAETLRHADRALALLGDDPGGMARTTACIYRAGGLARLGRYGEALDFVSAELSKEVNRSANHLSALLFTRALIQLNQCQLEAVAGTARRMLASEPPAPIPLYYRGYALYLLGVAALEQGREEDAEEHFRELQKLRYLTSSRLYADGLIGLALVAETRLDPQSLVAMIEEARSFALEAGDATSLSMIESLESRLARLTGSAAPPSPPPPAKFDATSMWLEVPSITHAENLLCHPDAEVRRTALPFVEERLALTEEVHNHRQAVRLSVLRVDALAEAGRGEEALALLDAILRRAEPLRMVRPFLGGGPQRRALLEALAATRPRGGILERLLGAASTEGTPFRGPADTPTPSVEARAGTPLSLREIETLELLARRLTNKQIAARLSVTPEAVKKRLQSIFIKLDVHGRREAVAAGVMRGIIEKHPL